MNETAYWIGLWKKAANSVLRLQGDLEVARRDTAETIAARLDTLAADNPHAAVWYRHAAGIARNEGETP